MSVLYIRELFSDVLDIDRTTRRIVGYPPEVLPFVGAHTTYSGKEQSSFSLRMIATTRAARSINTHVRHVFVRRVTRELNEAISTPPLSGLGFDRVGEISRLSLFSRNL